MPPPPFESAGGGQVPPLPHPFSRTPSGRTFRSTKNIALSCRALYSKFNTASGVQYGGRVVKALDLSSNGRLSAWVRTPPVLILYF